MRAATRRARPRLGRPLVVAAAALSAATLAACAGGSSDDAGPPTTGGGTATTIAPPEVPEVPPAPDPGAGVVVVGGTTSTFQVQTCRVEPDPAEPPGAQTLVALTGRGTTPSGVDFAVEVQRFATGTDVQTFTDTATYSDSARILQAQRIEVSGQVTDLRDPEATSALLRVRADGVSLAGLASGPGQDEGSGGLIGLALNATCG